MTGFDHCHFTGHVQKKVGTSPVSMKQQSTDEEFVWMNY